MVEPYTYCKLLDERNRLSKDIRECNTSSNARMRAFRHLSPTGRFRGHLASHDCHEMTRISPPPPFWRQTRSQLRSVQKEKVISSCTSLIMPMGHTLKVTTLKVDHAYCKYPRDISFSDMQNELTNQHLQLPNPLEETSQTFPAKCSERFSCRRANPYQCNQFSQEIPREQGNLPTSLESTFEQGKEIITQRVQVTSQVYS